MNRRHFLSVAAAAVAAAPLAACSGSSDPTASPSATGSSAASGSFPATVATAFGDVTVDKAPTRVVALGWGDAEIALDLGVQPVGASDWLGFGGEGVGPWLKGAYDKVPVIIETLEPSFEKIAALKPDLILDVKGSGDKQRHQRLAQIAPTVGIPTGGENYLTSPEKQLEMIAAALGQPARGAELRTTVDAAFASAAAAHPGWKGKKASAVTRTSEGWGAYVKGGDRLAFLNGLGFIQNPKLDALPVGATGFSTKLSAEKLDVIDADLVMAFPIFVPTAQLTGDAAFKAVPAVKKGHAVVIDGDLSNAFSLGSPSAQQYAIKQLVPRIEKAIGA